MFTNFKYIIPVTSEIFDYQEPFSWVPCEDFEQYMYPRRDLDNCAVYHFARGSRDQWDGLFHLDDCFGEGDQVFVATNNNEDAMMISLKYMS
jgi:predicted ribosome-associated RNA-binding protein Tma20